MSEPYIPAKDLPRLQWMLGFSTGINLNVGLYGLSPSDGSAIASAVQLYQEALELLNLAENRNPVNVADKDAKRNSATQLLRQYAMQIRNNSGISDADKINIGVRPINPDRDPVHAPSTQPVVNLVAATNGAQTLTFADSLEPNRKAKPFGAVSLQLFVHVGTTPPAGPEEAKFVGNYTRNPVVVAFESSENGKQATYWARWQGQRGDVGPWSVPASLAIAA